MFEKDFVTNYDFIEIIEVNKDTCIISNGDDTLEVPIIAERIIKKAIDRKPIHLIRDEVFQETGNDVDIENFFSQLYNLGFLKNKHYENPKWCKKIGAYINILFVSNVSKILLACLLLYCMVIIRRCSFYQYYDYDFLYIFESTAGSIVFYFILSWISVLIHELSHFFSANGFGISAKISLGTRLQFLVAQTKIFSAYKLKKKIE